jgi:hypothetical protein
MQLKATILSALLATTASAAVAGAKAKVFNCGTKEPSAEHIQISQHFAAQEKEFAASGNFSIAATISVDVYFHVVASSTAVADGYVTVRCAPFCYHKTATDKNRRTPCCPTSSRR